MPDPNTIGTPVPDSTMRSPGAGVTESRFRQIDSQGGVQTYALGVATVIQVDYEDHKITLRTENGETFLNSPTLITYPGAGARHFLGAMPMPGDTAVIGWGAAESGRSRQPYVLAWFPTGTPGHDWWVTQPFGTKEFDLTPKDRSKFEGIANRTRHKFRHMLPGNVVGSSAQGSDLVLDEGVLLANRRGNEIRLRDQDQAFVVRSLQQFHAGAGFRVYGGIVQRDATFLPSAMFSDGIDWDAPAQLDAEGVPLDTSALGASSVATGLLTPNAVFQRDADGERESTFVDGDDNPVEPFGGNVDPYVFLQKGLFVDGAGRATSSPSDAVYGGKAMYRVSQGRTNAAIDPQAEALAEYRIEVSHTSDGTLPVTEQTDGFDADRIPDTVPRLPSGLNDSVAAPFVEFVLGSVVGNDPFSIPGRPLYGIPLVPLVFGPGGPSPALASGLDVPALNEHAAVLLKVTSPVTPSAQPSFWAVTKDGRAKVSVIGPGTDFSAEAYFGSGVHVGAGRTPGGDSFLVETEGRIRLSAVRGDNSTNTGVEIDSAYGAVSIHGAGQAPAGPGGSTAGVSIQSDTDATIRAARSIILSAAELSLRDISNLTLSAQAAVALQSGDTISQSSKTRDVTSMGKSSETYSGPKDGLPTNGAVHEVTIATTPATGFVGGPADTYTMVYGDRLETIATGNHFTTVVVGNQIYSVGTGTWSAASGTNTLVASPAGVAITAAVGVASFAATAGAATISGSVSVLVSSIGPTTIKGSVVTLVAPSPKVGPIICALDLDPTSGLPFATFAMGSPTHLLAAG